MWAGFLITMQFISFERDLTSKWDSLSHLELKFKLGGAREFEERGERRRRVRIKSVWRGSWSLFSDIFTVEEKLMHWGFYSWRCEWRTQPHFEVKRQGGSIFRSPEKSVFTKENGKQEQTWLILLLIFISKMLLKRSPCVLSSILVFRCHAKLWGVMVTGQAGH